jgi:glutaredoxin
VTGPSPAVSRIELLTRPGCSLCESARGSVARIADEQGVPWTERNVDDDSELADVYGDRVPVVLLDGREHAYWRVEEQRLRDALQGRTSY